MDQQNHGEPADLNLDFLKEFNDLKAKVQVIESRLDDEKKCVFKAGKKTNYSEIGHELKQRYDALDDALTHYNKTFGDGKRSGKDAHVNYTGQGCAVNAHDYRMVLTDFAVEKAIHMISARAARYGRWGIVLFCLGIIVIVFGVIMAMSCYLGLGCNLDNATTQSIGLTDSIFHFIRGFTFYGLLLVLAVVCFRFARALLDQAESLYGRRHSLRQGRLYVHQKSDKLDIDEMERAFNWNASIPNAFSRMRTDSKAPWSNLVAELNKVVSKKPE